MRMSTQTASPHRAVETDRPRGNADPNHIAQTATSTAILFPGQGSQTPEMRELVARERPDLLRAAIDEVGEDPFPRADDGTNFAQPAIFCAESRRLGVDRLADRRADGRPLARRARGACRRGRGRRARRIGLGHAPRQADVRVGAGSRHGSMVAVIGAGAADHAQEIADASSLTVANDNSPMQIVLSGAKANIPAGIDAAKALGLAGDGARRDRGLPLVDDGRGGPGVRARAGRHRRSVHRSRPCSRP